MRRALRALLPVLLATPALGQHVYDGLEERVEVIGLQRWTLPRLQRAVARAVPGQALHDAACMVTLRETLGFRDASVTDRQYSDFDGRSHKYLVIKVVEPENASAVRWRSIPPDSFQALRPAYAELVVP
ncbi:MAG TPA: hypothetical protein VEA99_10270 [Gemmatimonadaceae bacterium]|nr:hypothetical protein [Gemmatimonadaceae bacterium]